MGNAATAAAHQKAAISVVGTVDRDGPEAETRKGPFEDRDADPAASLPLACFPWGAPDLFGVGRNLFRKSLHFALPHLHIREVILHDPPLYAII